MVQGTKKVLGQNGQLDTSVRAQGVAFRPEPSGQEPQAAGAAAAATPYILLDSGHLDPKGPALVPVAPGPPHPSPAIVSPTTVTAGAAFKGSSAYTV